MAKDGGQAFPLQERMQPSCDGWLSPGQQGMSLRDYFAAQALDRLSGDIIDRLAAPDEPYYDEFGDDNKYVVAATEVARRLSVAAYMIADAMLRARTAQP